MITHGWPSDSGDHDTPVLAVARRGYRGAHRRHRDAREAVTVAALAVTAVTVGLGLAVVLLGQPGATVRPEPSNGPGVVLCADSHVRVLPCR